MHFTGHCSSGSRSIPERCYPSPVPPGPPVRALPGVPARGAEEGRVKPPSRVSPQGAVDEPMTLWSAAGGDAAAL